MARPRRAIAVGQTALSTIRGIDVEEFTPNFSVTVNGLVWHGNGQPTFDEYEALGRKLRIAERGIQFAIGDFLNRAETDLGENAAQIIDYSDGWSEKTCEVYRWVASRVPPQIRRMDRLSIAHHLAVAALTPERQLFWLNKAADDEAEPWTVAHLRKAIKENDDLQITGYWVVASAQNAADQTDLMNNLISQGRQVKAQMKRERRSRRATEQAQVEASES